MATYDIGAVRTAIGNVLAGVTSLSKVYNYLAAKIEGYPAAVFELDNEDASILDDVNNTRVLTFKIWIVTEVPEEGITAASTLLDGVTKDVVNALEKLSNMALGGAADWTMPVIGQRAQSASPEGSILYQELMLKVYIASSIL